MLGLDISSLSFNILEHDNCKLSTKLINQPVSSTLESNFFCFKNPLNSSVYNFQHFKSMPVKRCLNFRLREREARKWTFVRDWEKEPTPSERDFRTSVSDVTCGQSV